MAVHRLPISRVRVLLKHFFWRTKESTFVLMQERGPYQSNESFVWGASVSNDTRSPWPIKAPQRPSACSSRRLMTARAIRTLVRRNVGHILLLYDSMSSHPRYGATMTSTPRTRAAALPVMLVAAAAIAAALPDAVTAADLKVVLNNFRGSGGTAYVALYDKAELFPKDGKNNYGQFFPVTGATGTVIFLGLKPGRYAVLGVSRREQ